MTWVLVFFISSGIGTGAVGGPTVIDNFKSGASCVAAGQSLEKELGSKLDWFKCIRVDK